jgi:Alpha/beta hydrolase domain
MRSALLQGLAAWVTTGAAMPPSRYPKIADGTLVPDQKATFPFPAIPGRPSPVQRPLLDYGLGGSFNYQDASGVLTAPTSIERSLPQVVVKVDADGNEVAGIKSPLLAAPLGTYTGWNVTAAGPLKGQSCALQGGFIPFAKTKAERTAHGDPRPSLEERYTSHEAYVKIVRDAAAKLVSEHYLLQQDADAMVKQAEASDVLR